MVTQAVQAAIEQKLVALLKPEFIEVVNESHMHSVPPNSETHFKVVLVAREFTGMRKVARHQKVYGILAAEIAGPVHALALHTYTEDEWYEKQNTSPSSPKCLGGSKAS